MMNGLDCLREELKKRGFAKQANSKIVAAVLDIVAESGNKYTDMWRTETDASHRLSELNSEIRGKERDINYKKELILKFEKEVATAKERRKHCEDYIDEFNQSLLECETQEGRDAMRIAQMFVNSVEIGTKYDNTAYIIGLASILSQGKVNAIKELHKINKKLPDMDNFVNFI